MHQSAFKFKSVSSYHFSITHTSDSGSPPEIIKKSRLIMMISQKKDIKKINNCDKIFFRDTERNINDSRKNFILEQFNNINRYYSSLHDTQSIDPIKINDCFALTLAGAIKEKITTERIMVQKDNSLGNKFYNELAAGIRNNSSAADTDLLTIYLKQMVNIMRAGGLIAEKNSQAYITSVFAGNEILYPKLLRSFWNECDWREIFPSSPEAAEQIHDNRDAFLELISGAVSETGVEDISNDFFTTTGICDSNDYFMISFMDFYLLTWLKHFGIIEYNVKGDHDIVYISINEYGRKILETFL